MRSKFIKSLFSTSDINPKVIKILGLCFLIAFSAIIFILILKKCERGNCPKLYYEMQVQNFNGKVTRKYLQKNHDISTVILDSEKQLNIWAFDEINLYDSILIGDIIYKEKGSLKCFLVRNNDTTIFEVFNSDCVSLRIP